MRGLKTVENRRSLLGKINPDNPLKKKAGQSQKCKFCPIDPHAPCTSLLHIGSKRYNPKAHGEHIATTYFMDFQECEELYENFQLQKTPKKRNKPLSKERYQPLELQSALIEQNTIYLKFPHNIHKKINKP